MKTTTATSQMSHARPFRWRRKHQAEPVATTMNTNTLEDEHNHHHQLTPRSSAIGQHHEHHHHQHSSLLSHEQNINNNLNVPACPLSPLAAMALPSTITHSPRYSPLSNSTTATTTTTITRNSITRRTSSHRTCRQACSLPKLMSLSILACVILSLLNLTIDQMQPKMVVAIGPTSSSSSSSQSTATLQQQQQQQQQSNSVIQYPTGASSAPGSTIAKAKYKTMYACEDRQLTMDCETGSKINLIRANFGRFSITQCNEQGQLDLSTDCMSPITFRIMQERCENRQRCSVNATSVLFGDRCPQTRKYLEVHFQCQPMEPEMIDVRVKGPMMSPPNLPVHGPIISPPKPPNNPPFSGRPQAPPSINYPAFSPDDSLHMPSHPYQPSQYQSPQPVAKPIEPANNQLPTPVINSQVMTPAMAIRDSNQFEGSNKLPVDTDSIVVSMAHIYVDNMARPRCYQWDSASSQWTERGARMVTTNQTHTICAFDQVSSYVLVMDYSGPIQPISPNKAVVNQPTNMNEPMQGLVETQPIPLPDSNLSDLVTRAPPTQDSQQPPQPQQQPASSARLFLYLLGIISVALALMTLTFVASSMRSSAGAALKSLGNFAPFSGPKYKQRRHNGDPSSLHSNKDLLVINNSNGHSFIYAPASTTKISSSSSTHILSTGGQPTGQHQAGTLHRLQQQQMYSGNGATLSSLSGTGAQSNNYYYGLTGLNPLLQQQQQQLQQQQQQQHHFSQHHLDQSQAQQAQLVVGHQQQAQVNTATAASYNRQANKSSVSNESANSSASSSGVESGSTSMQQQQQQARTQQACLVSAMNNNDFHLMGHHISNYGQHQPQQHNLFATLKGASVTHQPHQHQPTFTVNAHYSTSGGINGLVGGGVGGGLQSINMTQSQAATAAMLHNRQASNQMRDHIYECVDDDKPYMARLLMPTQSNSQHQIFGSPTFMSTRRGGPASNECGLVNTRQK